LTQTVRVLSVWHRLVWNIGHEETYKTGKKDQNVGLFGIHFR